MDNSIKQPTFEGRYKECRCSDGKQYSYTENCTACKGKGKVPKGTRKYKCKTCEGNGYTMRAQKLEIGPCIYCKGSMQLPLERYDNMPVEDREQLLPLFNFDKPYEGNYSSFNENYIGMGVVCGVTDYGRYRDKSPEEFRKEVFESFMSGYMQFVSITRNNRYPDEILIRKTQTGWFAYPVWNSTES